MKMKEICFQRGMIKHLPLQVLKNCTGLSQTEVRVKEYTASSSSYVKKVSAVNVSKSLENSFIKNYVTVEYLEDWWLLARLCHGKNDSTEEATINFL